MESNANAERGAHGISCLIADNHPAIVEALNDFLRREGIEVTGTARDGQEAIEEIQSSQPTVAVTDFRMPRVDGVEVARRLASIGAKTRILLYSAHGDPSLLRAALEAGARGFITKDAPLEELHRAIEIVAAGEVYVEPALAGPRADARATRSLTETETEVLRLLSSGQTYQQIGEELCLSTKTIRSHVESTVEKLGARTCVQALAIALAGNGHD